MRFDELLKKVASEPVFTSGMALTPGVTDADARRQFSRWKAAGKILQLRRKLYMLAAPYRKVEPHPFLIANRLKRASYISLQSALAHHGMIPEFVASVTSVTTGRPEIVETPVGSFIYRNVQKPFFHGYRLTPVMDDQSAFVATPEKALLDLVHLTPQAGTPDYLQELRLQNLEALDVEALLNMARAAGSPKLMRAAQLVAHIAEAER